MPELCGVMKRFFTENAGSPSGSGSTAATSVKQAATDSMEESVVNRNEWKLPAGDISTREWVTGFAQLRLW